MKIGPLTIEHVEFPGRAGQLQRAGAAPALIAELGDNYPTYHGFLSDELDGIGRRPRPEHYADGEAYFAAVARVHDLVRAEALLRVCRDYRRSGRSLSQPYDPATPLVADRNGTMKLVEGP